MAERLAGTRSDEQLVEQAGPYSQAELSRRLKGAIESLQAEMVRQQTSSNTLAGRIETLTRRLLWFTIALLIVALVQVGVAVWPLVR